MASKNADETTAELANSTTLEADISVDSSAAEPTPNTVDIPPEALADSRSPAMSQEQLSDAISHILLASLDAATKKLVGRTEVLAEKEVDSLEENHPRVPQPSGTSTPPIFQVPHSRNPEFVGRIPALSQLFGMWNPGKTSQARIAIVGLGGIG